MQFTYPSYSGDQISRRDVGHLQTEIDNREVPMPREILQSRGKDSVHVQTQLSPC